MGKRKRPPGPRIITEQEPRFRARLVEAVKFLEAASDALYQDQEEHLRRGVPWLLSLEEAHGDVRLAIERRLTRIEAEIAEERAAERTLPGSEAAAKAADPFAGEPRHRHYTEIPNDGWDMGDDQ